MRRSFHLTSEMVRLHPTLLVKYTVAILAFAVMTYFIVSCVRLYFSYPTQTRVSIRLNRSQLFPALTICSGNPVRYDKYLMPLLAYIRAKNLSAAPPAITPDDVYRGGFNFMIDLFNNNKSDQGISYGFRLKDILLDCTYNGDDCQSMWVETLSPFLGNCYTFNRQTIDKKTSPFQINYVNAETQKLHNGLIMTFYLNVERYFPVLEYGLGLTGILHHPDEQPLIRYAGKRFAPGFEHTVVYEKSLSTYLGTPYSSCTNEISEEMRALYRVFDNNTDYTYSETVCLELCQQAFMYERCGCIYPVYFYLNRLIIDGQLRWARICTPWTAEYQCTIEARHLISNQPGLQEQRCAHCQSQCTIYKYSSDLSLLKGPTDAEKAYYTKLILNNTAIPVLADFAANSSYYLDRNYLKLSVIPLNPYETVYEEKATYLWSAFISDIGGQSGLWLGLSVLSILELMEYLYKKMHVIRLRRQTKAQVQAFESAPAPENKV